MSQTIAPIRSTRRHRTFLVGAGRVDSVPPYAGGNRTNRSGGRPGVLSGNEALFPDRARFAGSGSRD